MKEYNGEKAIISLTSWKARINTVTKSLLNLLKVCPNFHIVLVLSEEEFPNKEKELPRSLQILVDHNLIEILWVYKNYKAFKKILFTMDKYRDVPIISADDDCLYKYNYAEELLSFLPKKNISCVTYWASKYLNTNFYNTAGYATCFSPSYFKDVLYLLNDKIISYSEDDLFYTALRAVKNIQGCVNLKKSFCSVAYVHDEIDPLHNIYRGRSNSFKFNKIKNIITDITSNQINYKIK